MKKTKSYLRNILRIFQELHNEVMMEIIQGNQPALFRAHEEFDFNNPQHDPVDLANKLIQTMNDNNILSLSAPQIGFNYKVFVMRGSPDAVVCFNPRVVVVSESKIVLDETCGSFPGLAVKIKRPQQIKVRYQNILGDTHTFTYIGMTARQFLHEMDHINGVNFLSRAHPMLLKRAMTAQKALKRKNKAL